MEEGKKEEKALHPEKPSDYFIGNWEPRDYKDVAEALNHEGHVRYQDDDMWEFPNLKDFNLYQKMMLAGFGDRHVEIVYKDKNIIFFRSVDSTITVYNIVDRASQKFVFHEELGY